MPGDEPRGMEVVGAARGSFGLADALREGAPAGAEAAESTGYQRRNRCRPSEPTMNRTAMTPFWYVSELQRQGIRRFPARCHRGRCRTRRARRLPVRRASEALHHTRHGDGSGQDIQRQRARDPGLTDRAHDSGSRHDGVPSALHAGRDRRASPALTAARSSGRPG